MKPVRSATSKRAGNPEAVRRHGERGAHFTLSAQGVLRLAMRCAMGIGVGVGLPLLAVSPALAAPFGSAQWFSQAATPVAPQATPTVPGSALPGRVVTPDQARAAAQQSIANLTRATQAIIAARDAQQLARAQALLSAPGLVPDGLGAGGLLPSAQAATDQGNPAGCQFSWSCTWLNAQLPQETQANGLTTVTVTQTAPKAVLSWDSFNVGVNTRLHFDQRGGNQSDGTNDWIALNRVAATASPSSIFGRIDAEGSVYLLNPNGILFGGSSQVNTHSLLASSLPLFLPRNATSLMPGDAPAYLATSNRLFLESGINDFGTGSAGGNILGLNSGQTISQTPTAGLPGNITLEAGADIAVKPLGYALVAAPQVDNAGRIRATDGQVVLAAGTGVALKSPPAGSQTLLPVISGRIINPADGFRDITPVGTVSNSGLIEAARGDVRLLGANVEQDGVVAVTSSISRPGNIQLLAMDQQTVDSSRGRTGSLQLASGSVTAILPDGNNETTISSAAATAAFRPGTVSLGGAAVTLQGHTVDAGGQAVAGALVSAPGQDVSIAAIAQNDPNIAPNAVQDASVTGRVYLDAGSTIDVAGIADTAVGMDSNYVFVERVGLNELADSPLLRDSVLFGASVVIDSRVTGSHADGRTWVGTPLARLEGYVEQTLRNINRMLVDGGDIDLAGNEVILREGSLLNLDAGFLRYVNNGRVPNATRLVTANGSIVPIGQATADMDLIGFAGKAFNEHERWSIKTVASDPLGSGGFSAETEYIEGGNGGRLRVFGASAVFLDGDYRAGTWSGRYQVGSGRMPQGGTLYFGQGGSNSLFNRVFPDASVVRAARSYRIGEDAPTLASVTDAAAFSATSALTLPALAIDDQANWHTWLPVSAAAVRNGGFSSLVVAADDAGVIGLGGEVVVAADTSVRVRDGGSIALTGSRVRIDGDMQALAGNISVLATGRTELTGNTTRPTATDPVHNGDIVLGSNARLDVGGEWVNDTGRGQDELTGAAFINGGKVTLQTLQSSVPGSTDAVKIDNTGAIVLAAGSVIDATSGGRMLPSGNLAGGLNTPQGRGGSVALETYVPNRLNFGDVGASPLPTGNTPPRSGGLQLDGRIEALGFNGGGTLSLRAGGILIGDGTAQPWDLQLPADFFAGAGFDNIVLQAEYNARIADGTQLTLQQHSYLPDLDALRALPTGSDLGTAAGVSTGLRHDYFRKPVNFSLYAGDYVNWTTLNFTRPNYAAAGVDGSLLLGAGAVIKADPGAAITLGSHAQVTVLGSVIAHGGRITLTGDNGGGGYAPLPGLVGTAYTSDSKSVWLGADSLLDVSGTVLRDPFSTATRADGTLVRVGQVLDGGTITLSNDTGHLVAQACTDADPACTSGARATLDVSGSQGLFDVLTPSASGHVWQERAIGSNAGTVRLGAGNGLFFNGKIAAQAGNAAGEGGTLLVTPLNPLKTTSDNSTGAVALEVSDAPPMLPALTVDTVPVTGSERAISNIVPLQPGQRISGSPLPVLTADWKRVSAQRGRLQFSTSVLDDSGISTLRLGSDAELNTAQVPVPVIFTGDTRLDLARALTINTSVLTATPPKTNTGDVVNVVLADVPVTVDLSAPYISLSGLRYGGLYVPPTAALRFGDQATLNVQAGKALDIGGQIRVDNWASVNLASAGDLRFVTPATYAFLGDPENAALASRVPGLLETTADLTLRAAQVYPATDERFVVKAHPSYRIDVQVEGTVETAGTPELLRGEVRFEGVSGAQAVAPMSVGGSLVVDARRIAQGGVLRAPGGQIVLGLGTTAQESAGQYDGDALDLLKYRTISGTGDAVTRTLSSQIFTTRYLFQNGSFLRTREERSNLPLLAATSVDFLPGSETSVAFGHAVSPYGSTVDTLNLRYNGSLGSLAGAATTVPDLTSAPAKQITGTADRLAINAGAVIDLRGGGALQAQEWVAGTGGSRDVLALPGSYTILPGFNPALAPYDPELASLPLLGKTVYLSEAKGGLPAGTYTLLPARYATLPGAWRLTVESSRNDFPSMRNAQLPDGSLRVAGHFVDGFSGTADARGSAFLLQANPVWRQYSEYLLTDVQHFLSDATRIGSAGWLPGDAGNLGLHAAQSLTLDGTFLTAVPNAAGNSGASLAIAAPQLHVHDGTVLTRDGFLSLDAAQLGSLDFDRMLLGGLSGRGAGTATEVIKPVATAVVVDTADTALTASELLLVAQGVSGGEGIVVGEGSRITAEGGLRGARLLPLQFGLNRVFDAASQSWRSGYNGSGALLRVSAAPGVGLVRQNPQDDAAAALKIGAGVRLTGRSIGIDSSGALAIDPGARFATDLLELSSGNIAFSDTAPTTPALLIGQELFRSFADIGALSLLSRGSILFADDTVLQTRNALTLTAARIDVGGHAVHLDAPQLTLAGIGSSGGAAVPVPGSGRLSIDSDVLRLAGDHLAIDGIASLDATLAQRLVFAGKAQVDAGAASVTIHAPLVQADSGAQTVLQTSGAMSLDRGAAAVAASPLQTPGGAMTLRAGDLHVDTTLRAHGGSIHLAAQDTLTLGADADVSVAGLSRKVFDGSQQMAGGAITLQAATGDIAQDAAGRLDISAGRNGADGNTANGGVLKVSATQGRVQLNGQLLGRAGAEDKGSRFELHSGGGVELGALVDTLMAGFIHGDVSVHSGSGNLELSAGKTLRAHRIALTADGGTGSADGSNGNLLVAGTLDASGSKGGEVDLYARGTLRVDGTVHARGSRTDRRGGRVLLRTDAGHVPAALPVNTAFGYGQVSSAQSGAIVLGSSSHLDVSGGSAGGLSGGHVALRAPLLHDGEINVTLENGSQITGARELALEAFAVWDTRDSSTGAQHFDGVVDPAGRFSAAAVALPAGQINADHAAFYTVTLRDFVRAPGFAFADRLNAGAAFTVRPGIVLRNEDSTLHNGDIRVVSDWNLGAGTVDADGLLQLDYRHAGYLAPVLTFSAVRDVSLQASLSDGFFQLKNPFGSGTDNSASPGAQANNPLALVSAGLAGYTRDQQGNVAAVDSSSFVLTAGRDVQLAGNRTAAANTGGSGNRPFVAPTMLRTGNGSISVNAGRDLLLNDPDAPGVIYTAGRVAEGTTSSSATRAIVLATRGYPTFLDSGLSHPQGGGNVRVDVGNDIRAVQVVSDVAGTRTGAAGANLTQLWWPWMQRACLVTNAGCSGEISESTINFAMFGQGVMSIGGDIDIHADGFIDQLAVSSPVTWKIETAASGERSVTRFGGGNLRLFAGTGIGSGNWFVAQGEGEIRTLGSIAGTATDAAGLSTYSLGTVVGLQDAAMNVVAGNGISLDAIVNPSWLFRRFDSLNYSTASALSLQTRSGDILLGNAAFTPGQTYGISRVSNGLLQRAYAFALPASLSADNWAGDLRIAARGELYPSATGNLSLVAGGDVALYSRLQESNTLFGMIDASANVLPSPLKPVGSIVQNSFIDIGGASRYLLHTPQALHRLDPEPLRIYSVDGSLIDGNPETKVHGLTLFSPKLAEIRAGRDIVNLAFSGQNLLRSDVTVIGAGRDIYNTQLSPGFSVPFIELGGEGALMISAGRHLGPIASTNDAYLYGYLPRNNPSYPGIRTIADERNAWLPRTGASILLDFGTAGGVALEDFAAQYLDPAVPLNSNGLRNSSGTPDYRAQLIPFVHQYMADQALRNGEASPATPDATQAWQVFQSMPRPQRSQFVAQVFLDLLNQVGFDYNNPESPYRGEYLRGYRAIETLFPAAYGYTRNALDGVNGSENPQLTGVFDMRGSVVQTRRGGDISILGPGGGVLVGSVSAPPAVPASLLTSGVGPGTQGILAMGEGDIGIFTDASVLLAQSRIFTVQGGDLLIWSSNGDINAGKGAKTSSEVAPTEYLCDPDRFCRVDSRSQVSGAGIAALQMRAGGEPGTANLVAPVGTVDAGDAGIRSSGALNVAAFQVANADNIAVSGSSVGVPTGGVDAAVAGAASAAGAAASAAANSAAETSTRTRDSGGVAGGGQIDVVVVDYGNADCEANNDACDRKKKAR